MHLLRWEDSTFATHGAVASATRARSLSCIKASEENDAWARRLDGTRDHSTEIPKTQPRRSQRALQSTKNLHGQLTPPDRPLPRGEGWGEGLPATSDSSI